MSGEYNLDLEEGVDFRVRRGHWLPRKLGIDWIAFGKTLYCRTANGDVPKHEFLHIVQFSRYGVPRVVCHYLFHAGRNFCRYGNVGKAFREVPFEVEARDFEAGRLAVTGWESGEAGDSLDVRPEHRPATWKVKTRIIVAAALTAVLFSLGSLVMLLVACLTLFRARRFYAEVMARWLSLGALWLFGVRIEREPYEFADRQTVFISNHTSMIDMFIIIALGLPNSRYFLSGFLRKFLPLWLVGRLIGIFWTALQTQPERRTEIFQNAERVLRRTGESVFLTPEGQVTWRFNKGAFHLATNLEAPIQPIYIEISDEVDPGPWFGGDRFNIRPGLVRVHFKPSIPTEDWSLEELELHRDAVKNLYLAWHRDLQEPTPAEAHKSQRHGA